MRTASSRLGLTATAVALGAIPACVSTTTDAAPTSLAAAPQAAFDGVDSFSAAAISPATATPDATATSDSSADERVAAMISRNEAVDRACHAFYLAGMAHSREWNAAGCVNVHYSNFASDPTDFRVLSFGETFDSSPRSPAGEVLFSFGQDVVPAGEGPNCGEILIAAQNDSDTEVAEVTIQPRGARYTDVDDAAAEPTYAEDVDSRTFTVTLKPGEEVAVGIVFCTASEPPVGARFEFGFGLPECVQYRWITGYAGEACMPEKLPGPYS